MKKFDNNKTICFLGDSITTNSTWISIIYEYYITHFPDSNLKMIGCGVSGGGAQTALMYMENDLYSYNPDHVVIMYGMNECDRDTYKTLDADSELAAYQQRKIDEFYTKLSEVAKRLKDKGIPFSFCTNTPTNNWIISETPEIKYSNVGLRKTAEVTKKVAKEFGVECVDFFEPMYSFMEESAKINKNIELTWADRVHPNEYGNSLMATLFLNAQGFEDIKIPTAQEVADGSAFIKESERMKARQEAEMNVRYFWIAEWLILKHLYGKPQEEKTEFVKKYIKENMAPTDFFKTVAEKYLDCVENFEKYYKEHIEIVEKIYNM